jgi:hypothetical protein
LGQLSINKKTIDVTMNNQTKVYGYADPTLTYYSAGLVGNDGLAGAASRTAGEDVAGGPYAIDCGTLHNDNYILNSCTPGSLTITSAPSYR